jgi:alkyl hydroperoxide reductase subunit AhpC
MKTVGNKLSPFRIVGVKPGRLDASDDVFEVLNEKSFPGKWKVIVFYPKDFTFV